LGRKRDSGALSIEPFEYSNLTTHSLVALSYSSRGDLSETLGRRAFDLEPRELLGSAIPSLSVVTGYPVRVRVTFQNVFSIGALAKDPESNQRKP
jgi:hypothetical protein